MTLLGLAFALVLAVAIPFVIRWESRRHARLRREAVARRAAEDRLARMARPRGNVDMVYGGRELPR